MSSRERPIADCLAHAAVLVELGSLHDAEREVADVLDREPDELDALALFAKIKHIKGELSQAIACWAQLRARAFQHRPVTHQLRALFAMRSHQAERAAACCIELAMNSRECDPATYKLAVLALARIAELTGEPDTAAAWLERLGSEPGFVHDNDLLLALARVYEQLGGPERLAAAFRVLAHLDHEFTRVGAPKISLLARQTAILDRLGEVVPAREMAARYLAAFRRRAHRPTLADAARAAADRYIPLTRLVTLWLPPPGPPADASMRTRGVAAAIDGDRVRAGALFTAGEQVLDDKYLADLAVLRGDDRDAARRYLAALEADPGDPQVVGWLVEHAEQTDVDGAVRAAMRREPGASAARACLLAAVEREPRRAALWHQLAILDDLAGNPGSAARRRQHADAVTAESERESNPIGRVLAASVYAFAGRAKGLIHEIWAHRRPVTPGSGGLLAREDVLGNLTDEMKESVRSVFLAVREYALAMFPDRTADLANHAYGFKLPKEDEPSGGLSAGLPSALVFLSVLIQRPIPADLAFTGTLIADAHDVLTVGPVGDVEAKVKAAYDRNLRAIVIPTRNRPGLQASIRVPAAICAEIVRFVGDLDEAVRLVWGPTAFGAP